jgi:hypothetical protein
MVSRRVRKLAKEFSMQKAGSLAILAAAILLTLLGVCAMDSVSSDVSRFFTGDPTDEAMWILSGGIVATGIALARLFAGDE